MKELRERVQSVVDRAMENAGTCSDLDALEKIRVSCLGRKGALTQFLRGLGELPQEARPEAGKLVNDARNRLEAVFESREADLKKLRRRNELLGKIDITLPGRVPPRGGRHPLRIVMDDITRVFTGMGFEVAHGPEIELDYFNFEALNIPKNHPARDMQDSFYISEETLLRTHTSPVQVRTMSQRKPPVRVIAPGKVYRSDQPDATHSPMFHQVEGFAVGTDITFGDLKGTLTVFASELFGKDRGVRFRPSYFPFTEPSAEVDISCIICGGKGCRVCSRTGWLEILGAGMIHPKVLEAVGYDPENVSGFAFGMGVERIALLKYGIDDIRLFFENDLRFLEQFQ